MARVLDIDRNALVRGTIRAILELEGHDAVLARDDHEGIQQFRSRQFDLAICEVFTPDLAGPESISQIRRLSATKPIIAMPGGFADAPEARFSSDLLRIARHNGATLTLLKPFRHEQLMALVRHCLR
jgi:CheY-like chemotaxis protein